MIRPRVPETDRGIQGPGVVELYDRMQRRLRDNGWIETRDLLRHGVTSGLALEIGPGPGYLGLEWLQHTRDTTLTGADISADMIALARRNARACGLADRVEYVLCSGARLPFDDGAFDAVFTAGSLHEWTEPKATLDEIGRVLKPGGAVFIADFRRDMSILLKCALWLVARPAAIRPGLLTSIHAAYAPDEAKTLLAGTRLSWCDVVATPAGLKIIGRNKGPARSAG